MSVYIIESIRNLDGSIHEREARRKGQRVELSAMCTGYPLFIRYIDDGDDYLRTSAIRAVITTDCGLYAIITTKNTVYTFRKGDEE